MSQAKLHWLVARNNDDLVKQSREIFETKALNPGQVNPLKVAIGITRVDPKALKNATPLNNAEPGVHRLSPVSGEELHFDVSSAGFDTAAEALEWATSESGVSFLKHRRDAVVVAVPKP
jgi:hypothetical protein